MKSSQAHQSNALGMEEPLMVRKEYLEPWDLREWRKEESYLQIGNRKIIFK